MLQALHIENIAVIEQADIELENGLTVLSGETGAGKSIIIDSIGAILGRRVSRDLVRAGAKKGFVSAVFTHLSSNLQALLEELTLAGEEPDALLVQRQITADGKNTCRVNMKPTTQAVLRQLAPFLIDIHGQNDGQKLLNEQRHIHYLDNYADNAALLENYHSYYQSLLSLRKQITALEKNEQERLQRIDLLSFQQKEIEDAALQPNEETALLQRKKYFDQASRLVSALEQARQAMDGEEMTAGACALLDIVSHATSSLQGIDETYDRLYEQTEEVRCLAEELRDTISNICANLTFSPAEREMIEQRLDELYRLKKKYGDTVDEILSYHDVITTELKNLQSSDQQRDTLRAQYRETLAEAKRLAHDLTESRRAAAVQLEKEMVLELSALDMDKVRMSVTVSSGSKLSTHGFDMVTFAISANPGEPEKPLSKVASGGELSRIMLALKNILTTSEDVGALIFDEIDTGVSGHAAQQIARKLSAIAQKKQTLCVTHLPQIAAMGDHHLFLSKSIREGRSFTDVQAMNPEQRIDEIARLLSGDHISEAARRNAEELLSAAQKNKGENTI